MKTIDLIGASAEAGPAYAAIKNILTDNGYSVQPLWKSSAAKPQSWRPPTFAQPVFYIVFRAYHRGMSVQETTPDAFHYLLCHRPHGALNVVGEHSPYEGLDTSMLAAAALAHVRRIEQSP